jgi:SAM-dependent methyltransferase
MPDVRTALANGLNAFRARAHTSRAVAPQAGDGANPVERYWTRHTVRANRFSTARASERYLEWRFREYPLFREFSGLWGDHGGEVILDYGCGPGNDLTGFAVHTTARRIIGMDVSPASLDIATRRLALHDQARGRVELVRVSDSDPAIPLADDSVDHVNCQGVLHHTSHPDEVLAELARVLRPGGTATIMVYNRDSVWLHLCTAYERMIVDDAFPGVDVEEAFRRNTDGPECPISRCYHHADFIALCEGAGLEADVAGGYLSQRELRALSRSWAKAIADPRLAAEHRDFLRGLTFDPGGHPMHGLHHAGIGGTYRLRAPEEGSDH